MDTITNTEALPNSVPTQRYKIWIETGDWKCCTDGCGERIWGPVVAIAYPARPGHDESIMHVVCAG